jgi:hypothetical protein
MHSAFCRSLFALALGAVSGSGQRLGAQDCEPLATWRQLTVEREGAFGFCPPLGTVFRAKLAFNERACPAVEYRLELSIIEEGVRGKDACLENVWVPGDVDCVKETQLPPRILTGEDFTALGVEATVFEVLSEKLLNEPHPNCGAIDPCLVNVFNLDALRVTDGPCDLPRVLPEDAQVLLDLFERLREAGFEAPPLYYPLAVGNRWGYVVEHHLFTGTREVAVEAQEDDLYVVRSRSTGGPGQVVGTLRLRADGNQIDIQLPPQGLVPYYRFEEDSWVHNDPFECDQTTVTVAARDQVVDTPAGRFTDCLRLDFAGRCADAGLIAQWWAPGVGLVKAEEGNFTGAVTWLLSEFEVGSSGDEHWFVRGDSNDDARLELTDAVHALNFLFLGGEGPPCPDAADSDDDGGINISDAIHTLGFLFLGGPSPPAPYPVSGPDPTPDTLGPCRPVPN